MPSGNRKGPNGEGPKTGRGLGYCSGNDEPGYVFGGRGLSRGQGIGNGFGNGFGKKSPYNPRGEMRPWYKRYLIWKENQNKSGERDLENRTD